MTKTLKATTANVTKVLREGGFEIAQIYKAGVQGISLTTEGFRISKLDFTRMTAENTLTVETRIYVYYTFRSTGRGPTEADYAAREERMTRAFALLIPRFGRHGVDANGDRYVAN